MVHHEEKTNPHPIRYRLLAQYRDNTLKIEDLVRNTDFKSTAHKVASNTEMIALFGSQDACIIGYIAGSTAGNKIEGEADEE